MFLLKTVKANQNAQLLYWNKDFTLATQGVTVVLVVGLGEQVQK